MVVAKQSSLLVLLASLLSTAAAVRISSKLDESGRPRARKEPQPRPRSECGFVSASTIVEAIPALASEFSDGLKCGDDNSQVAASGRPNELHFMLCVMTTKAKLTSYMPPGKWAIDQGLKEAIAGFARANTTCKVEDFEDFLFFSKPSDLSTIMHISQACFNYEKNSGDVDSVLRGILKSVNDRLLGNLEFPGFITESIFNVQNWKVMMIFGIVLGYHRKTTEDFFLTSEKNETKEMFDMLYDAAADTVLALLKRTMSEAQLRGGLLTEAQSRTSKLAAFTKL